LITAEGLYGLSCLPKLESLHLGIYEKDAWITDQTLESLASLKLERLVIHKGLEQRKGPLPGVHKKLGITEEELTTILTSDIGHGKVGTGEQPISERELEMLMDRDTVMKMFDEFEEGEEKQIAGFEFIEEAASEW